MIRGTLHRAYRLVADPPRRRCHCGCSCTVLTQQWVCRWCWIAGIHGLPGEGVGQAQLPGSAAA